jgi:hypothetical protein
MRTRPRELLTTEEIFEIDPQISTSREVAYRRSQIQPAIYELRGFGYEIDIEKRDGFSAYTLLSEPETPIDRRAVHGWVVGQVFRTREKAEQHAQGLELINGRKTIVFKL